MNKSRSGFTIVELLIVIVVIGILAAITVVAYRGIQSRAQSAAALSVVDSYQKVLEMYKATNGYYPLPSVGGGYACLGEPYAQTENMAAGVCWRSSSFDVGKKIPTFDTALAEFSQSVPKVNTKEYKVGGNYFRGVLYYAVSINGDNANQHVTVTYALGNNADCGRGKPDYMISGSDKVLTCVLTLQSYSL